MYRMSKDFLYCAGFKPSISSPIFGRAWQLQIKKTILIGNVQTPNRKTKNCLLLPYRIKWFGSLLFYDFRKVFLFLGRIQCMFCNKIGVAFWFCRNLLHKRRGRLAKMPTLENVGPWKKRTVSCRENKLHELVYPVGYLLWLEYTGDKTTPRSAVCWVFRRCRFLIARINSRSRCTGPGPR